MYVVLKRPWRGYPAEEPIDMPASDARSALSTGVGVHGTEWKRQKQPETAARQPPEDAAERTERPKTRDATCGARLSSGGVCSRDVEGGGRCWQHEEN